MKCGTTLSPDPVARRQPAVKSKAPPVAAILASVFVVVLIAAVVIPNLIRVRMTPGEGTGAGSLRAIVVAQVTYQSMFGEFATDIKVLGGSPQDCSQPSRTNACLIDTAMANSSPSSPKSGYYYVVTMGPNPATFVAAGIPVNRFAKGYCAVEDGVVRIDSNAYNSGPPSYEACKLLPPLS